MRDVRSKSYRRASVRKSKRQSWCSNSMPSSNFSMHSIDRSMYRIPPSKVGAMPVARRRPREMISLLCRRCKRRRPAAAKEWCSSGFARADKWMMLIIVALYSTTRGGGGGTPTQHHHHRPTSSVMKSPADPPVPLPGPVHPIGDACSRPHGSRWLAQPHTACASERHQDSVDPV